METKDVRNRKALLILGIVLITVGILALIPLYFVSIPDGNAQILSVGIGIVLGWGSSVVGFYFVSSEEKH